MAQNKSKREAATMHVSCIAHDCDSFSDKLSLTVCVLYLSSSSTSQVQVTADGTLPRGLTVTGEGTKHEEHVYEDPLYLKHSEAYSAPIYRIPRPITDEHTSKEAITCDEAGYEIIDHTTKAKKPKSNRTSGVSVANPKYECSNLPNTTVGYYEIMQHPSSLGKEADPNFVVVGSPAPYLTPVGISDTTHNIPAGYSLLGVNSSRDPIESVSSGATSSSSPSRDDSLESYTISKDDHEVVGNVSTTGYANISSQPNNDGIESKTTIKIQRAGQEEYISMQSAEQ